MLITGVLIPGDFGHGGLTVKYKNDYVLKNVIKNLNSICKHFFYLLTPIL